MKTIVMIPTYNEKENIKKLIDQVLKYRNVEVVVVDDYSPDGTWEIVRTIARKNKRVRLIVRKGKRGRGLAGIAGFKHALNKKADFIIEMDADFSHDPFYIPKLLEKIKRCDIVLGSRAVESGGDIRDPTRRLITKLANLYIRIILGLKVKDCNSGYRCFRRKVLEDIELDKIISEGPSIVQEILFKAYLKGFKICEIPIMFRERKIGKSKLGVKHLYKGYIMVLKLKLMRLLGKI